MLIEAVDLASVSWAACLGSREVDSPRYFHEFCAADFDSEILAVQAITGRFDARISEAIPDILVIEDLPHGVLYGEHLKNTIRMQGRIIERMDQLQALDKILFLQPKAWQDAFGLFRKKEPDYLEFAIRLGYRPPDLVSIHEAKFSGLKGAERAKVRAKLKKLTGDHVAAFLIYAWAQGKWKRDGTFDDIKTAQRYMR